MKEYLLLFFIAFVGLSGLFLIHQEVRIQSLSTSFVATAHPKITSPLVAKVAKQANRLLIERGNSWSEITVSIRDFKQRESLVLDMGNGMRRQLEESRTKIVYQNSGIFLIKLFKGDHLLEAQEIELRNPLVSL